LKIPTLLDKFELSLDEGVLVFATGFGSRVSTLSLISYWISDDSKAALYAAIAVVENIGHAVGDPSLQQIFAATLRLHLRPVWQALPFFVAAVSGLCIVVHFEAYVQIGSILLGGLVDYVYKDGERRKHCRRC
jgi:hypothetical protein